MWKGYLSRELIKSRVFYVTGWAEKQCGDSILGRVIISAKTLRKEKAWFEQGLKQSWHEWNLVHKGESGPGHLR